ncbi:hypothetical protein FRB94_009185 [Tulasnella sp. JGI-2019a]|nr:hypothetical protein FRB94_009185 [Tulasnella sp. JGI-2019a]KAG9008227.1 hypothetical protein FRB93_006795 [Tulasnella sp. JGI-2019a]
MPDPNSFSTGQPGADHHEHQIALSIRGHNIGLPIGLNYLGVDSRANLRVRAYADNPVASSAIIRIATWGDIILNSGGYTWFEVGKNDRAFQYGIVSTMRLDQSKEIFQEILFEKAFAEPPKVISWLNLIDIDRNYNCCIYTDVRNVNRTGFTLHIATCADTIVHAVSTTWIAHPTNRSNITSGSYLTGDFRP